MMEPLKRSSVISALPQVKGRYRENVSLGPLTWFRVGGPADVLYKPSCVEDLGEFLRKKPQSIPCTVLGVASNVLVRDGGIPGVTIRLTQGFSHMTADPKTGIITAGAGVLDRTLAMLARDMGIQGMEFLCGIPGTLGGALRMNAGAYGTEIKDIFMEAQVLTPQGLLVTLGVEDMGFSYRQCSVPEDWIFVGAKIRGIPGGHPHDIGGKIQDLLDARERSQPVRTRTGGSTFANPPGGKAWELIHQVGGRDLTRGGAKVSELHCNFLVNTGTATAQDLEALGEEVRQRVKNGTGVDLRWEIRCLGVS